MVYKNPKHIVASEGTVGKGRGRRSAREAKGGFGVLWCRRHGEKRSSGILEWNGAGRRISEEGGETVRG